MSRQVLTPDLDVAEAGRVMMAQQAAIIADHGSVICTAPDVTAVHEMRKGIRRTFTSFELFDPYYNQDVLRKYKKGLRRIMRRLARSRDLAVFLIKLSAYNETAESPLPDLEQYWQTQHALVDEMLQRYLSAQKRQSFLANYFEFTATPGMGVKAQEDPWAASKIAHLGPVLIFQRIAAVRAFGDKLENAEVRQLHRLRIQFKELRYSLQFFEPLLGGEIEEVLISLKESQQHLGDLNDANVALALLDQGQGLEESVAQYRTHQEMERQRLVDTYLPVWQAFDRPEWRQHLAHIMVAL